MFADVASALTMAGVLDYTPALNANLNVDDTGNTFAGVLAGKFRVYIDPYAANVAAISTTLQVIRVHHLMTQVYSTAHTFLYRWYVVWEQTVSSQKLDSRLVTESLQTHLLKVQHSPLLVFFHVTATYTTEELKLLTLCNSYFTYFFQETLMGLFFCLNTYKAKITDETKSKRNSTGSSKL